MNHLFATKPYGPNGSYHRVFLLPALMFFGLTLLFLPVGVAQPTTDTGVAALIGYIRTTLSEEPGDDQTIGLIDEDVDLCNPGLFRADAGAWPWIDVNGNGLLDIAVDQVDLGSGPKSLSLFDAAVYVPGDFSGSEVLSLNSLSFDQIFRPAVDWLFVDLNANGVRDCGALAGYSDTDPALGEPLFILDDINGDGIGSQNEHLLQLGTSRVRAIRRASGEYIRGNNLAVAASHDAERTFHGTAMLNVVGAGPDISGRYAGVAPMADWVIATAQDDWEAYTGAIWAEKQGINVLLVGITRWALEPLDGSSPFEQVINRLTDNGVVVVTPAGNLGSGSRHASADVPPGVLICVPILDNLPVSERYLTVSWLKSSESADSFDVPFSPQFFLATDGQSTPTPIPQNGATVVVGDPPLRVTGLLSETAKSTHVFTAVLASTEPVEGDPLAVTVCIRGIGMPPAITHWFVADNAGQGADVGTVFPEDWRDPNTTLTSPATADSPIVVGAVGGRFTHGDGSIPGQLRPYSSRGPRIDGAPHVTVIGPDDHLVSSSGPSPFGELRSGDWIVFGGTSAAAAHVAGGITLLRQLWPQSSVEQVRDTISAHAVTRSLQTQDPSAVGAGILRLYETATGRSPATKELPTIVILPEWHNGEKRLTVDGTNTHIDAGPWRFRWDFNYDGQWDTGWLTDDWVVLTPPWVLQKVTRVKVEAENVFGYRTAASTILTDDAWVIAELPDTTDDAINTADGVSSGADGHDATPNPPSNPSEGGCSLAFVGPISPPNRGVSLPSSRIGLWAVATVSILIFARKKSRYF